MLCFRQSFDVSLYTTLLTSFKNLFSPTLHENTDNSLHWVWFLAPFGTTRSTRSTGAVTYDTFISNWGHLPTSLSLWVEHSLYKTFLTLSLWILHQSCSWCSSGLIPHTCSSWNIWSQVTNPITALVARQSVLFGKKLECIHHVLIHD